MEWIFRIAENRSLIFLGFSFSPFDGDAKLRLAMRVVMRWRLDAIEAFMRKGLGA